MFCHKCGTQLPEDSGFCHKCGTKVIIDEVKQETSDSAAFKITPSPEKPMTVQIPPVTPVQNYMPQQQINLTVIRKKAFYASLQAIEVFVDNIPIGKLASGGQLTYQTTPGKHCIMVKMGRYKKAVWIELFNGDAPVIFECEPLPGTWSIDLSLHTNSNRIILPPPGTYDESHRQTIFDKFSMLPNYVKVLIVLTGLAVVGVGIFIIVMIISAAFSSLIAFLVTVALLYVIYHRYVARYFTSYKYTKESKTLQLPEGMNSKTLLEVLSGKFNYPYFRSIRYNGKGECVIKGRFSEYTVEFLGNDAVLNADIKNKDKKSRSIMLEAIATRQYINKFFNPTLPYDAVKYYSSLKIADIQRKIVGFVFSAAMTLIVIIVIMAQFAPNSLNSIVMPGAEVRNAYLSQYSSSVTIEKAFDNYFDNGKWSTFSREGVSFVAFTGNCTMFNERADVRITFKITGEKFLVDSLEVNGRTQSDIILYSLLSSVYDKY